jgi:hypothetical protein
MALTFAERMAALKKPTPTTPLVEKEQAAQPVAPAKKVFGKPSVPLPSVAEEATKATIEAPVEEVKVNTGVALGEVGNIILLANEANKIIPKDKTEGEQLVEGELPTDAIRIKQKIAEMETFDGISLRNEMDQLKKLIKASPDACLFLLPEELGLCVRALRRMTDNKVAMDMGATKAKASKKQVEIKLTAEDIAAALDDL